VQHCDGGHGIPGGSPDEGDAGRLRKDLEVGQSGAEKRKKKGCVFSNFFESVTILEVRPMRLDGEKTTKTKIVGRQDGREQKPAQGRDIITVEKIDWGSQAAKKKTAESLGVGLKTFGRQVFQCKIDRLRAWRRGRLLFVLRASLRDQKTRPIGIAMQTDGEKSL